MNARMSGGFRGPDRAGLRSGPYRRGSGRSTRLRPPPSERTFGPLPSKKAMLDCLGCQATTSAVPHSPGLLPLVQRQTQAEGLLVLNNRHLIQLGLRLQQSLKTDSQPVSATINALHTAALTDALNNGEGSSLNEVSLAPANRALVDQAMNTARDLCGLLDLIDIRDQLEDENDSLQATVVALSSELESALKVRAELEECESTAGQLLQQESTAELNVRIEAEQQRLMAMQKEIDDRKLQRKNRLAMVEEVSDRLKSILETLDNHQLSSAD